MTVTLLFLAALMAVFVTWLISQSINVTPWMADAAAIRQRHLPQGATAPRLGLLVLLAVITSMFALTTSAYLMRKGMGADWRSLSAPALLWGNTAILLMGSIFLQVAWNAARGGDERRLRLGLAAGGGLTVAFIAGQYLVWQQLYAAGYYLTANPANAFFYMMTGLHALHLLGGLVAWLRSVREVHGGASALEVRASVELCTIYWHYLFIIWVILFSLILST